MNKTLVLKVEDPHERLGSVAPACLVWLVTDSVRLALRNARQSIKAAGYCEVVLGADFTAPQTFADEALMERLERDERIEVPASPFAGVDHLWIERPRMAVTETAVWLYGHEHFSGRRIESSAIPIHELIGDAAAPSLSKIDAELRDALKLLDNTTAAEGSEDPLGQAELAVVRALEEISGRPEKLPREA